MTAEEAILLRVAGASVSDRLAIFDGGPALHWGDRPQGAPAPCIVFTMIDPGTAYSHGGRDGLRVASIQADCLAETYGDARAIADELGILLESSGSVGSVSFHHGFVDMERDAPVIDVRGGQTLYGRTQRLSLYLQE